MDWGTFDFSGMENILKKLEKLTDDKTEQFMKSCAKELALRLLAGAKERTPVGQYPAGSGKVGGTLRRGWSAEDWAANAEIKVEGGVYTAEIINPVEYASYVEYGHRTQSGGFVPGRYMLKISEDELRGIMPSLLEKRINEFIAGL